MGSGFEPRGAHHRQPRSERIRRALGLGFLCAKDLGGPPCVLPGLGRVSTSPSISLRSPPDGPPARSGVGVTRASRHRPVRGPHAPAPPRWGYALPGMCSVERRRFALGKGCDSDLGSILADSRAKGCHRGPATCWALHGIWERELSCSAGNYCGHGQLEPAPCLGSRSLSYPARTRCSPPAPTAGLAMAAGP